MLEKCGNYLGEGFRRIIYEHKDNPKLVIKFLKDPKDRHNFYEFDNWLRLGDTERGLWLAPCYELTPDFRFLTQMKVEVTDEIPSNIPEWIKVQRDYEFGGNKSRHWGRYQGRLVLIDYGDMQFI